MALHVTWCIYVLRKFSQRFLIENTGSYLAVMNTASTAILKQVEDNADGVGIGQGEVDEHIRQSCCRTATTTGIRAETQILSLSIDRHPIIIPYSNFGSIRRFR
jgi:hypothetical protein